MGEDLAATASPAPLAETIARMRTELERAVKFDSVKAIRDRAEALRGYAKSIGAAQSALNSMAEIKIRAERRMGWELAHFTMNQGGRPAGTGDSVSPVSPPTLADLGIHKKSSQRWQTLARMPSAEFEAYLMAVRRSGVELTAAGVYRAARNLEQSESPARAARDNSASLHRELRALERAWARAGDAARRAFFERHFCDLLGSGTFEGNVVPLAAGR
jgi:hypothetical protein